MSRIFDETSFHFSPLLKQTLIKEGRLAEINSENDFPDAALVRTCVDNRLDLPSIRRTLLAVGLPVEMAGEIETKGLAALPALDQACWEAFQKTDAPLAAGNVALAGPFLGIGWGVPIHEHQNRLSARWIGAAQQASMFLRVPPGTEHELSFTIHHVHPPELQSQLSINVCGRTLETRTSRDPIGRTVLSVAVPADLSKTFNGRLWVRIGCFDTGGQLPAGHVSLVRFAVSDPTKAHGAKLEEIIAEKDLLLAQQGGRMAELEARLQAVYASRSWRVTAPLRGAIRAVRASPLAPPLRTVRRWLHH